LSKSNSRIQQQIDVFHAPPLSAQTPSLALASSIIQACLDSKGSDLEVLDVSTAFGLADYFVIVSGRSDRHVQGLVNRVLNALEDEGHDVQSIEGYENGHWVVVDCGDVVLHAFYEPVRESYDIESHWAQAPRMALNEDVLKIDRRLHAA
jgi:ribosome-associated protein